MLLGLDLEYVSLDRVTARRRIFSRRMVRAGMPTVVPFRVGDLLGRESRKDTEKGVMTAPAPMFSAHDDFGDAPGLGRHGKAIMWFRSDLRLDDNAAFMAAVESSSSILPVFCFDPRQFGKTQFGFEKTGRHRARFIIESVENLRANLRKKGSDLVIRLGIPEEVLPELARSCGCKVVYYHREVTYDEQKVEKDVRKSLEAFGVEAKPFWGGSLYHLDDLPFEIEKMPDVYTEFRETVEASAKIRDPVDEPEKIPPMPKLEPGKLPSLSDLGLREPSSESSTASVHREHYNGGETEARRRLDGYIQESLGRDGAIASNSAFLGAEFSCRISPWLALGCLSPRRIFSEMKDKAARVPANRTTTYFELVWRDFFKFITWKYGAQRLEKNQGSGQAQTLERSANYIQTAMAGAAH